MEKSNDYKKRIVSAYGRRFIDYVWYRRAYMDTQDTLNMVIGNFVMMYIAESHKNGTLNF